MRVIVTRPHLSGRRTAEKLRQRGHMPVVLPLTAPTHDVLATERALEKPYGALAITSAEAVRALSKLEGKLDTHRTVPLFTVGKVTAAVAREAGFTTAHSADGSGLELATLIADYFAANGTPTDPLLYLAGRPRASGFERALTDAAIAFRTVECYHMLPIDHDPDELRQTLVERPVDVVLFYSRENVERFFSLPVFTRDLSPLHRTRFLCLSRNIANAVPPQFDTQIDVAASPEEEDLLYLL